MPGHKKENVLPLLCPKSSFPRVTFTCSHHLHPPLSASFHQKKSSALITNLPTSPSGTKQQQLKRHTNRSRTRHHQTPPLPINTNIPSTNLHSFEEPKVRAHGGFSIHDATGAASAHQGRLNVKLLLLCEIEWGGHALGLARWRAGFWGRRAGGRVGGGGEERDSGGAVAFLGFLACVRNGAGSCG